MFVKGNLFPAAALGLRLLADIHPGLRCGLAATLALGCDLRPLRGLFPVLFRDRTWPFQKPQNAPEAHENTARGKPVVRPAYPRVGIPPKPKL